MFTGIVQGKGEIAGIEKQGDWLLTVAADKPLLEKLAPGSSVACNGICLTVIEQPQSGTFKVQISHETLSKTTALHWQPGLRINLEPALRAGDEIGGHFVSGHIDGVARLAHKEKQGDSLHMVFEVPHEYAKFVAGKGSIALDGVSLTVNEVEGARFGANIIPFTQTGTNFGELALGEEVNFEVDLMARYTERMLQNRVES